MRRSLGALIAAAGVVGCGPLGVDPEPLPTDADVVERSAPPLTAAEIRLFLRETTLTHQGETRRWHVYLREDGTMSGLAVGLEDETRERSNGTWRVTDEGLFCRQWESDWGGGRSGCAEVFRFGKDYVFLPPDAGPDAEGHRRRRAPGNTMGL